MGRLIVILALATAGCKGDAAKYVGKWKCKMAHKEKVEGVEMQLEMEGTLEALENGRENHNGTMTLRIPVPEQPGLSMALTWEYLGSGTYEFTSGKLCSTLVDIKLMAKDEVTQKAEKEMGTAMQDILPKGISQCAVYELTTNRLTTTHDEGTETCTR